jgi:cell shape-determining protein MreD
MGYYLGIIILALLATLQNSILPEFRQFDGQPELVMLAVLAWAWHASDRETLFWAFTGGIMQDVLNPVIPTGLSVISIGITALILKTVEENLYQFTGRANQSRIVSIGDRRQQRPSLIQYIVTFPLSIVVLIAFSIVGTLLQHTIIFSLFNLQGYVIPFNEYVREFTIPTLALNLLIILPLYWVLRRIQKRISS